MPSTRRKAPFGYKWVVRYKNSDGSPEMSLADHHFGLSAMITALLMRKVRDITITYESIYKDE